MSAPEVIASRQPAAEWPTAEVVTAAQADPNWRPLPFLQYVLKLHGNCNLACDYCYVYELADQSWRYKPAMIGRDTIARFAVRLGEHTRRHGLREVDVVFHGGEPLLAGAEMIDYAATVVRREVGSGTSVRLSIQTNGVLLDDRVLPTLLAHDVYVSVSLDGGREAHDRHRRYRNGNGSYDKVIRGLSALRAPRYAHLYASALCTIDVGNDPLEVYQSLLATKPPAIDFLLPHGTWDAPPPLRTPDASRTPYADWLIPVFDRWYSAPVREVRVRLFEELINAVLGGVSRSEVLGLGPLRVLIVDTDGSLELADTLKSTFEGAPATGLSVDAEFDAALTHPGVVAQQLGRNALCATCLQCPVHELCGAGQYPHRYRSGTGFLNPSVYCPDLIRLIHHIRTRVIDDVRTLARRAERSNR
jgi:uncharacterized protein